MNQDDLAAALESGNLRRIKNALKAGADINGKDRNGTPLAFGVRYDAYLVWRDLFKLGLDPNITDADGGSLLTRYSYSSYIMAEIISAGADVEKFGPAAVRIVIRDNNYEVDEELRVFPNRVFDIPDEDGNTALQYALASGKRDAAAFLIAHTAALDHRNHAGETAMSLAQKNIPDLVTVIQGEMARLSEDRAYDAAREKEGFWRRNFLKPGFIFDVAFSIAALFITPLILSFTAAARKGQSSPVLGWILVAAALGEIVALTFVLPTVFRQNRRNSLSVSLFFYWIAHFAMQVMLAVELIIPALGWKDPSDEVAALMIFFIVKEFYVGILFGFAAMTSERKSRLPSAWMTAAQTILATAAFLYYTALFEGMSHAELLEGIDPNIADYFIYKVFHFGFVFFLIFFPARMAFLIEDKLSIYSKGDRWVYRAGLVIAFVGGTWGLYTGPAVTAADITAREERFGQSRLMQHITYAPYSYLERLIAAGIDVNARDNGGRTALHKAVYNRRKRAIRLLLKHKADPNVRMPDGTTPLHLVFRQGWSGIADGIEMTEMLLQAGANPEIKDKDGRTILEIARREGYAGPIAEVLEKYTKRPAPQQ